VAAAAAVAAKQQKPKPDLLAESDLHWKFAIPNSGTS